MNSGCEAHLTQALKWPLIKSFDVRKHNIILQPFYLATIIPTDHVITSTIFLYRHSALWTFLNKNILSMFSSIKQLPTKAS